MRMQLRMNTDHDWFQAAEQGNVEILERMLRAGFPVDTRDPYEVTALMKAVGRRHRETVELLLRHGAHVNARDYAIWTPLTYAVDRRSPRYSPPWTPGRWDAPTEPSLELVARLKEAGAVMTLREAVILGDVKLVRRFCKPGTSVNGNARWLLYDTYLMVAADLGHLEVVRLLLDHGARIADTDDLGEEALMRAALGGHADVVTLLLNRGAEIDAGWDWETALSRAATEGHRHVVDLLLSRGAKRSLTDALYLEDMDLVKELMPRPGNEYDESCSGRRLNWIASDAIGHGNITVLRRLLDHTPACYRAAFFDPEYHNLLSEASVYGHAEIVQLLLDQGADPRAEDGLGMTPLAWAVRQGHDRVAACLKQAGADR